MQNRTTPSQIKAKSSPVKTKATLLKGELLLYISNSLHSKGQFPKILKFSKTSKIPVAKKRMILPFPENVQNFQNFQNSCPTFKGGKRNV